MYDNYLSHHGILGQKWGIRRYQNPDGSLTSAGKKRYGEYSTAKEYQNRLNDLDKAMAYSKRDYREAQLSQDQLLKKLRKRGNLFEDKGNGHEVYRFDRNSKRDTKASNKLIENSEKMARAKGSIDLGEKEVKKLLKQAEKKGYTIEQWDRTRSTMKGKDYASVALATIGTATLLGATMGVAGIAINPGAMAVSTSVAASKGVNAYNVEGKGYKVKEPKRK